MTGTRDADPHRPHDRATLRVAARELRSRGLTARDIAQALRLSEAAVVALLANQETQA
jgi:predicted transcriptional regulator